MAGIRILEKKPGHLAYVLNELLKPDIKSKMLDDAIGFAELSFLLMDPFTVTYGIFEKGHPVPIGAVILEGIRPFRGCEIHAAIFKPENRGAQKLQSIAQAIRGDLISRWNLHYAGARVLSSNAAAKHVMEKLGMTKVGTKRGNIMVNGEYADIDEYYVILDGDKAFSIETGGR